MCMESLRQNPRRRHSDSEYKASCPMWIPDLACFPLR
jgi:hypothetical protein